MNEPYPDNLEEQIRETAAGFSYPPTPDITSAVHARLEPPRPDAPGSHRLRTIAFAALAFFLLASLVTITAVPPARAALLRILRIGAVQINLLEEPLPGVEESMQQFSIADLGREISLEQARELITISEPAFPPPLGYPDAIYGQNFLAREPVVSYFWQASNNRPQILLTQIEIPQMGLKWAAGEQFTATEVADQPAAWIEGPHLFDLAESRLIPGTRIATNVLIWSDGGITYRLEGDLSQGEALRIAESWP
jgi:hypothetical protein